MPAFLATCIFFLLILGLFWLDRDSREKTSVGLWIPVAWLSIIASRPVSLWLTHLGLYSAGVTFDSPEAYAEGSPVDRLVFAVLIVAAIVTLAARQRKTADLLTRNIPLLILALYCGISTLWAEDPAVSLKRWVKYVGDIAMICVVLTDRDRTAAVSRLLVRTGFILIPLSVLLIRYYPDLGRTYHIWTWTYMYTGVTLGKNMLGVTCLVLGLASLWCFLRAYGRRREAASQRRLLAHGLVVWMAIWLLAVSNSMTSMSCFLLAASILIILNMLPLARRSPAVHLLVLLVIAVPFTALFLGLGDSAVESLGRDPTLTGRTAIWNMVIRMTDNPMLGAGFESFWTGQRLKVMWSIEDGLFFGIQSAHNGFLEVFANLGSIGVMLICALLIDGYRKASRALRVDASFYSLSLVYVVVAILYNFTEAGFRMMTPVSFALLLAVMSASVRVTPAPSRVAGSLPHPGSARQPFFHQPVEHN